MKINTLCGYFINKNGKKDPKVSLLMSDEEIEEFMELLKEYMIKSEIEIIKWKQRQEYYKGLAQHGDYLEKEAAKMEVTVDYYMNEFLV